MSGISNGLQKAIDALKIEDVYLHSSTSECADDFDPKYAANIDQLLVQQMNEVNRTSIASIEGKDQYLRVFISFAVRWIEPNADNKDKGKARAVINAQFVAEYAITDSISDECIDEFAVKNAIFHVWPYWREYLSRQCERLRLPRLVMPAMQLAHHRSQSDEDCKETNIGSIAK